MRKLAGTAGKWTSYANVTATIALVFALGGGAYAAATLPRNSVGSAQIRTGAVGSSEIRNGAVRSRDVRDRTLGVRDLSLSARQSLRGATGPAGAPAVTFRASIAASGDPTRGNATGVQHGPGSNDYRVSFSADLSSCVPSATLDRASPAGEATVAIEGAAMVVRTFDSTGAPRPAAFHVIAAC